MLFSRDSRIIQLHSRQRKTALVKEAEKDRSASVESAAGKAKNAVKRPKTFGTEIADDGALVPGPGPFDWIEVGGVGR